MNRVVRSFTLKFIQVHHNLLAAKSVAKMGSKESIRDTSVAGTYNLILMNSELCHI